MSFRTSRPLAIAAALTVITLPLSLAAPALAEKAPLSTSQVSVFHAIPNIVVDVYANGEVLLTDFEQGALTEPVTLPKGEYDLKLVNAGDGADGKALLSADNFEVPGGENLTVVAHLDAKGTPVITPYVNDNADIAAGEARLTVRHIASAAHFDVLADGDVLFSDLANADQEQTDLPAGTISAEVVRAGTDKVKIDATDIDLDEGVNTVVYAWGDAQGGKMTFSVQKIQGIDSAPNGVPGGTGGQSAAAPAPLEALALGGLISALVALSLLRFTTRRAH